MSIELETRYLWTHTILEFTLDLYKIMLLRQVSDFNIGIKGNKSFETSNMLLPS